MTGLTRSRQSRSPPILPLSLDLSSFPDTEDGRNSEPAILPILRRILPAVTTIPITLQGLNGKPFNPTSSGEDLHSGCLQQPNNSLIVATEIGMTEGRVTEQGESTRFYCTLILAELWFRSGEYQ
jgi:hypothetical protein